MRRNNMIAGFGLMLLLLMGIGTRAEAQAVRFRFTGGHWSHGWHSGWHRYWGGPGIGFYYAPTPVYVVPGYEAASYYVGPDYWYSNPSFGLNVNIGGGGGWHGNGWHGTRVYHNTYNTYNYHGSHGHGNYGSSRMAVRSVGHGHYHGHRP